MSNHSSSSSASPVVKGDGLLQRFRGLLCGKRGKKKPCEVKLDTYFVATAPFSQDDATRADGKNSCMLRIVVILLDPKTRRFELIQVELDPLRALVCHVVPQLNVSSMDKAFRKQTYQGICGCDGEEMPMKALIAQFCKTNEIFVGVPKGVTAQECAELALPILTDPKVLDMLQPSGIDVSAWIDCKNKRSQ